MDMVLNCAILHTEKRVIEQLEAYINKMPFLSLCGKYTNPVEALKDYYGNRVQLYFVGIVHEETEAIGGMEYSKLLSAPTRVIFVADSSDYAAECFRLDALDYLITDISFRDFFESVNKASRWFSLQNGGNFVQPKKKEEQSKGIIYVKSDCRNIRLDLPRICYIEGLGDYVKIYQKGEPKPVLCLCSMKYMEEKLPSDEFIRVHRSFIIRKDCIRTIGSNTITLEQKDIPVGEVYRKNLKTYIANFSVL